MPKKDWIKWDDVIPVGKYKGMILKEVFDEDPKYIEWVILNWIFVIDDEVQAEISKVFAKNWIKTGRTCPAKA